MSIAKRIIPPVYFLGALLLMVGLHYVLPLTEWIRDFIRYSGITLIVIGVAMAVWGARAFAKAGTPVKPFETTTTLVTHGLYRFTRNPMYLGMVLVLLGTGFLLGSLTPLLVIPIFMWLINSVFIKAEEDVLEELFGDEYLEYKKKVGRWI